MSILKRVKLMVIFLLLLSILTGCTQTNAVNSNKNLNESAPVTEKSDEFILYDSSALQDLKNNSGLPDALKTSVEKIVKSADSAVKAEPLSVTQKKVIEGGVDPHEYISMAIYYWPDSSKADGKPYINKDGQVNPEKNNNDKYDASRFSKMISTVNTLGLAYYLTDKEDYAKRSAEFLRTWFINAETKMNPNLDYGQGVPGKNTGSYSGIIDTASLITIIDSVKMIEKSQSWSQEDSKALKKWFSDYVNWLQQSTFGKKESEATNNHSVWYDAQVASFAYYAGRDDIAKNVVEQAKTKRIQAQIQSDGSMPRELARTRSMDYTMYNLEAFATLAQIGEKLGIDLWNYNGDGKSIKLAYDYLYPYLKDKGSWKYQNIVQENSKGFAPYLAIAAKKLNNPGYGEAAYKLLEQSTGKENIMVYTFLKE